MIFFKQIAVAPESGDIGIYGLDDTGRVWTIKYDVPSGCNYWEPIDMYTPDEISHMNKAGEKPGDPK